MVDLMREGRIAMVVNASEPGTKQASFSIRRTALELCLFLCFNTTQQTIGMRT